MKFDEKTGRKIPESRMEAIRISQDDLKTLAEKSNGTFDRDVELAWLLRDIDHSLAIITDMLATYLGWQLKGEKPENTVQ